MLQFHNLVISEIKVISANSELLFASNKEFDSLIEAIRANRKLQQLVGVDTGIQNQVLKQLQQTVSRVVEYNRLSSKHSDLVWGVAISPDGQLIASASDDKTVQTLESPWQRTAYLKGAYRIAFGKWCSVRIIR